MSSPRPETDVADNVVSRLVGPDEDLSPAAQAALECRSIDEHHNAVDRALRRR